MTTGLKELIDQAGRNAVCAGSHKYLQEVVNEALELAAKACEEKVPREAGYGGAFGGYGGWMGDRTGPECAAAVRDLKVEVDEW